MAVKGINRQLMEAEMVVAQNLARNESECAKLLGVSYATYKKYAKMYNIFGNCRNLNPTLKKKIVRPYKKNPFKLIQPIDLILQNKYKNLNKNVVKNKLIDSGIKNNECELCGFKDVRESDGKVPIILHFLDKNEDNYAIDNLQFACFNCSFIHFNLWNLDLVKLGGWGKYQKDKKCEKLKKQTESMDLPIKENETCN